MPNPLYACLQALTVQMHQQGIRRLLVISGEPDWCAQQAQTLAQQLTGDWLWLGDSAELPLHCHPQARKTLQGREFRHAIMDARYGLDVQALAVLAGNLAAGSLLLLLTPPWNHWLQQPDADSVRWNDGRPPCITANFIRHWQQCLQQDEEVIFYSVEKPSYGEKPYRWQPLYNLPEHAVPVFAMRPRWQPASGAPLAQQQQILDQLLTLTTGVVVVSAARGRGKSALAGMLIAHWPGTIIVTAPTRTATDVMAAHAGSSFHFMAPDTLLATPPASADWLIIDEAAALPTPQLYKLITLYPRTLLTTTVQGYEGTGRGFLLKFCAGITDLHHYRLHQPIRWADNDPLERLISQGLFFDDNEPTVISTDKVQFHQTSQQHWQRQPHHMAEAYRLLTAAHYRTSPLDLRRMMDAAGQHFVLGCAGDQVIAALWLVTEGGLPLAISRAIWAGVRRPPGNLVAQSLAAHGSNSSAACLHGLRISRIVVHPARQRQGIGRQLIQHAITAATGYDYLSVSFGYTDPLWHFWQQYGFQLVRFGSQRETSSGCYTAMALLPLSEPGQQLIHQQHQQLQRDAHWLQRWIDQPLPFPALSAASITDRLTTSHTEYHPVPCNNTHITDNRNIAADFSHLNRQDWLNLAGFAFAHRPLATTLASLCRLLLVSPLPLSLLRARVQQQTPVAQLCQQHNIAGSKALLCQLRQQTATALYDLNPSRSQQLCQKITSWQKEN